MIPRIPASDSLRNRASLRTRAFSTSLRSVRSRTKPVKTGGPSDRDGTMMSSAGNSLPPALIAVSSIRRLMIGPSPVAR